VGRQWRGGADRKKVSGAVKGASTKVSEKGKGKPQPCSAEIEKEVLGFVAAGSEGKKRAERVPMNRNRYHKGKKGIEEGGRNLCQKDKIGPKIRRKGV